MSLYRRSNTGPWWYRFEVCGVEHRAPPAPGIAEKLGDRAPSSRSARGKHRPRRARARRPREAGGVGSRRATSRGATEGGRTTLERQWLTLGRILGAFTDAARVRYADLERFVSERRAEGARGQTISRELQTLRRGLNLARKRGKVARVPADWPEVRADAPSEKRGHLIPLDVLDRWLDALPLDAREEAEVVLLTGIRAEEVRRLEWSWVEAAPAASPLAHILRLPASGTKNRKERIVGLPDEAHDILERRAEVAPTGPNLLGAAACGRAPRRIEAHQVAEDNHAPRSPPHACVPRRAGHRRSRSVPHRARSLRRRDDAALPLGDRVAECSGCRRGVDFSGPRVGTEGRHSWKGLRENPASSGAGDGTRTRDPELGKLMLYQLSYARTAARLSTLRRRRYSRTALASPTGAAEPGHLGGRFAVRSTRRSWRRCVEMTDRVCFRTCSPTARGTLPASRRPAQTPESRLAGATTGFSISSRRDDADSYSYASYDPATS